MEQVYWTPFLANFAVNSFFNRKVRKECEENVQFDSVYSILHISTIPSKTLGGVYTNFSA